MTQVGDMPTRFKYVPVQPQAYALTPAEILMATDQELNEYMSVKKYAPYRQDKNNRNKKTQEKLHELKAKIGERAGTSFMDGSRGQGRGEAGQEKVKKRKGKKERMKLKAVNGDADGAADAEMGELMANRGGKSSKKRKRDSKEDRCLEKDKKADEDCISNEDGERALKKRRKRKTSEGRST